MDLKTYTEVFGPPALRTRVVVRFSNRSVLGTIERITPSGILSVFVNGTFYRFRPSGLGWGHSGELEFDPDIIDRISNGQTTSIDVANAIRAAGYTGILHRHGSKAYYVTIVDELSEKLDHARDVLSKFKDN